MPPHYAYAWEVPGADLVFLYTGSDEALLVARTGTVVSRAETGFGEGVVFSEVPPVSELDGSLGFCVYDKLLLLGPLPAVVAVWRDGLNPLKQVSSHEWLLSRPANTPIPLDFIVGVGVLGPAGWSLSASLRIC